MGTSAVRTWVGVLGGWSLLAFVACTPENSPPVVHAPLIGGEITLVMQCMERSRESMRQFITPFRVEGCSEESLKGARVDPSPVALHVSPECNNRLVHITTEDYRFNEIVRMDENGSFVFENLLGVSYFPPPFPSPLGRGRGGTAARDCVTWFHVKLEGRVQCQDDAGGTVVLGSEIHSEWEEASELMQPGCPSTLPCRFKTATDFRCI